MTVWKKYKKFERGMTMREPYNLIFAKHSECGQNYLFRVPCGVDINKGEKIYVDTIRGETLATAVTDNFYLSPTPFNAVADGIGAYLPLKYVTGLAEKKETYQKKQIDSSIPF